jgi:hypothetical protein
VAISALRVHSSSSSIEPSLIKNELTYALCAGAGTST